MAMVMVMVMAMRCLLDDLIRAFSINSDQLTTAA